MGLPTSAYHVHVCDNSHAQNCRSKCLKLEKLDWMQKNFYQRPSLHQSTYLTWLAYLQTVLLTYSDPLPSSQTKKSAPQQYCLLWMQLRQIEDKLNKMPLKPHKRTKHIDRPQTPKQCTIYRSKLTRSPRCQELVLPDRCLRNPRIGTQISQD